MKRIRITAICISLLATLSMVGCMCTPGIHPGLSQFSYGPQISYGYGSGSMFDDSCGPCGTVPVPCAPDVTCGGGGGIVAFGGNYCAPCPPVLNCRSALSNIGNGTLLIGRGVLDITAAPFVIIGNLLSSGCQYEVIAHCPEVSYCGPAFHSVDPCCSVRTSGCNGCDDGFHSNGYIEEFPSNDFSHNRATLSPPMPRRNTSVIQAGYREPITPGIRFVQPR